MKWLKAAAVGAIGSLVMFIFIALGTQTGFAPFNIPPSAAFLETLGLNVGPLALLLHFGHGMFWSIVLVAIFQRGVDIAKGVGLGILLWLVMMVVHSPIIGWGFFGFGAAGSALAPDSALYLGSPVKYIVATLVLHLIYGFIIGWLNPLWINFEEREGGAHSSAFGTS